MADVFTECALCRNTLGEGDVMKLYKKGSNTVNRISREKDDLVKVVPGQRLHKVCYFNYCRKPSEDKEGMQTNVKNDLTSDQKPAFKGKERMQMNAKNDLTSDEKPAFNFSSHCLFCGTKFKDMSKKDWTQQRRYRQRVTNWLKVGDSIAKVCHSRNDDWSKVVLSRLRLHDESNASETFYHMACRMSFTNGRRMPREFRDASEQSYVADERGRRVNETVHRAFCKVIDYIDANDKMVLSLEDLVAKMQEYLAGSVCVAYGRKHLKHKLMEHYGNKIIATEIPGRPIVLAFRVMMDHILLCYFTHQQQLLKAEPSALEATGDAGFFSMFD